MEYMLQYFKREELPGYDYLPRGCEQMKHGGVIGNSDVKIAMHEL